MKRSKSVLCAQKLLYVILGLFVDLLFSPCLYADNLDLCSTLSISGGNVTATGLAFTITNTNNPISSQTITGTNGVVSNGTTASYGGTVTGTTLTQSAVIMSSNGSISFVANPFTTPNNSSNPVYGFPAWLGDPISWTSVVGNWANWPLPGWNQVQGVSIPYSLILNGSGIWYMYDPNNLLNVGSNYGGIRELIAPPPGQSYASSVGTIVGTTFYNEIGDSTMYRKNMYSTNGQTFSATETVSGSGYTLSTAWGTLGIDNIGLTFNGNPITESSSGAISYITDSTGDYVTVSANGALSNVPVYNSGTEYEDAGFYAPGTSDCGVSEAIAAAPYGGTNLVIKLPSFCQPSTPIIIPSSYERFQISLQGPSFISPSVTMTTLIYFSSSTSTLKNITLQDNLHNYITGTLISDTGYDNSFQNIRGFCGSNTQYGLFVSGTNIGTNGKGILIDSVSICGHIASVYVDNSQSQTIGSLHISDLNADYGGVNGIVILNGKFINGGFANTFNVNNATAYQMVLEYVTEGTFSFRHLTIEAGSGSPTLYISSSTYIKVSDSWFQNGVIDSGSYEITMDHDAGVLTNNGSSPYLAVYNSPNLTVTGNPYINFNAESSTGIGDIQTVGKSLLINTNNNQMKVTGGLTGDAVTANTITNYQAGTGNLTNGSVTITLSYPFPDTNFACNVNYKDTPAIVTGALGITIAADNEFTVTSYSSTAAVNSNDGNSFYYICNEYGY